MINKSMDKDQTNDTKPKNDGKRLVDDEAIGHAMDRFVITDRTNNKILRNRRG